MTTPNLHQRAVQLHHAGFTRAAIDVLEVALREAPDDGRTWQLRAVLLHETGRYAEALDNIERAQTLVVLQPGGWMVLADCLRYAELHKLAAETYRYVAADHKVADSVLDWLQQGFAALGLWADAASVCRRALKKLPDDAAWHVALAESLQHLDQPGEVVLPLVRRAVQLAPTTCAYRVALVAHLLANDLRHEAYQQFCRLPASAMRQVCCRCCLRQFLELVTENGDVQRARWLAEELARRHQHNQNLPGETS